MGIKEQGAHEEGARLADADEVRGGACLFFQRFQDLFVLFNLPVKIFIMTFVVDVKRNILSAFLFYNGHAGQALVPHVEGDALSNVGMVPRTGRKDHPVVLDFMFHIQRNVNKLETREVQDDV